MIIDLAGGEMPFNLFGRIHGYPMSLYAQKGLWSFAISLDPDLHPFIIDRPIPDRAFYREGIYLDPPPGMEADAFEQWLVDMVSTVDDGTRTFYPRGITDEEAFHILTACGDEFVAVYHDAGWLEMSPMPMNWWDDKPIAFYDPSATEASPMAMAVRFLQDHAMGPPPVLLEPFKDVIRMSPRGHACIPPAHSHAVVAMARTLNLGIVMITGWSETHGRLEIKHAWGLSVYWHRTTAYSIEESFAIAHDFIDQTRDDPDVAYCAWSFYH